MYLCNDKKINIPHCTISYFIYTNNNPIGSLLYCCRFGINRVRVKQHTLRCHVHHQNFIGDSHKIKRFFCSQNVNNWSPQLVWMWIYNNYLFTNNNNKYICDLRMLTNLSPAYQFSKSTYSWLNINIYVTIVSEKKHIRKAY